VEHENSITEVAPRWYALTGWTVRAFFCSFGAGFDGGQVLSVLVKCSYGLQLAPP